MFSSRVPPNLEPNRLSQLLARKRALGRTLIDLTESNPTRVGLRYDVDTMTRCVAHPAIARYAPDPKGLLSAREAICRFHGDCAPDDLFLTASTSEAYSVLFKLLCNSGEQVLVPQPSYPLLEHLTALDAIEAVPYHLRYDGAWHVDLDGIGAKLNRAVRAIVLVSPNNPTGSFVRREELDRICDLCRKFAQQRDRPIVLIGDEVFADYAYQETLPPVSVSRAEEILAFSLHGLSKTAGMPQMKLGWIRMSGPPELRVEAGRRLEVICDTYLSVSTPVQLATSALLEAGRAIREQIRARVMINRAALADSVSSSHGCCLLHADGGWYAVLRVPLPGSEERLVLELADQDEVVVHPGYFFDFEEAGFVVLSLLPPPDSFRSGVSRLLRRVSLSVA